MDHDFAEPPGMYDAPDGYVLPDLFDLRPAAFVKTETRYVDEVYFDTAQGHLNRVGIALCKQRGGGDDDGWQVRMPPGSDVADVHLASRATTVPRELSRLLLGARGGERLIAALKVSTTRVEQAVFDEEGALLAVVNEHRAASEPLNESALGGSWHYVTIDFASNDDVHNVVEQRILAAGGTPGSARACVFEALGTPAPRSEHKRLAGLVDDYLQHQLDVVAKADLRLRTEVDVTHSTRVAIRRLRSTLQVYADVFDTDRAEALETEVAWFAGLLGRVRDSDVLCDRLLADVEALPAELVIGPVAATIVAALDTERTSALKALQRAMSGARYAALVTMIEQWRIDPPYSAAGANRRKTSKDYVAAAEKRLRRRLYAAARPGAHEDRLHSARKAGKRLRYAAELAAPVLGKSSTTVVKAARGWHSRLGEFQDSVIAAERLQKLGAAAGTRNGENGFTYGVLLGQEWHRAEEIRAAVAAEFG